MEFVESIQYRADISDLQAKIRRIEGAHDGLGSKSSSVASKMVSAFASVTSSVGKTAVAVGKVATVVTATLGGAVVALGPRLLEQGAALDALAKKSATVFEGSLGSMQKWADANAKALGLTSTQLVGLAAATGDLLKPMGFTAAQAADMSITINDLSGALSAWSGGTRSAAEVSAILTKALLGERDSLKELGISITEADVAAVLAAKGQEKLTGVALEQAKALATQELILAKSVDAQKAWADGSMDAIKSQNAAKASLERLKETFTRAMFPVLQAALPHLARVGEWLEARLPGAIATVRAWFDRNWPAIQAVIGSVVDWLRSSAWPVVQQVFAGIVAAAGAVVGWVQANWPAIRSTIGSVVDWLRSSAWPAIQAVAGWIIDRFGELVGWVQENWPEIRETIAGVVEAVQVVIEKTVKVAGRAWEMFGEDVVAYARTAWETIRTVVQAALDVVRGVINTVTALIRGDWSAVWNGLRTIVSGAWSAIQAVVAGALGSVRTMLSAGWKVIRLLWDAAWSGIKAARAAVWAGLVALASSGISGIVDFVGSLPGRAKGALWNLGAKLVEAIRSAAGAALQAAKDLVSDILREFTSLPGRIVSMIPGVQDPIRVPSPSTGSRPGSGPSLPRLAAGGAVFAPTVAVVGDNPGARTDPEIVAPQSMLQDMMRSTLAEWSQQRTSSGPTALVVDGRQLDAWVDARGRDRMRGAA